MGSNAKKKTTMAKLNRESRLRERRADKKAKKDARKLAALEPASAVESGDTPIEGEVTEGEVTEQDQVPIA
jgi:hypothetical protein